jgi:general secretion pathway protein A
LTKPRGIIYLIDIMRAYEEFFGFKAEPFERAADIDLFYPSTRHEKALVALETFISSPQARLAVITGDAGTGKTLVLRRLLSQLPNNIIYDYLLLPGIAAEDILQTILVDFEAGDAAGEESAEERFQRLLADNKKEGLNTLIVIDDAHTLSPSALSEIAGFLKNAAFKIILSGEKILKERLSSPDFSSLEPEYAELTPLPFEHCKAYIAYRVKRAGLNEIFIPESLAKKIWEVSKGNPTLINAVMKRLVVAAYLDNSPVLKEKHFLRAARSLNLNLKEGAKRNPFLFAAIAVSIAALSLVGTDYFVYKKARAAAESREESASAPESVLSTSAGEAAENPFEKGKDSLIAKNAGGQRALVGVSVLNLRNSPELSAAKLAVLRQGDRVLILEERPEWLRVEVENGQVGWVFKPYIKIDSIN